MLSPGKSKGILEISKNGLFTCVAIDQRESLAKMLSPNPEQVSTAQLLEAKKNLADSLAPLASGILIDPATGGAQYFQKSAMRKKTGLLVSAEKSGYTLDGKGRVTELLADWPISAIKSLGASAVKLLLYYTPEEPKTARKQLDILLHVVDECKRHDIAFLCEPMSYAIGNEKKDSTEFARKKPKIVIETARKISGMGIDILKSEFPCDLNFEKDEEKIINACEELASVSEVPWVVLSAGVDFPIFKRQVEFACASGASGFLAGRAIWKEAFSFSSREKRKDFLHSTSVSRLKEISKIVREKAAPFDKKYL